MNIEQKSYVKWARPYLNKKNAAAMTKKRAIKIIMAATCCGNRRWSEDIFTDAKSKIAGKPRPRRGVRDLSGGRRQRDGTVRGEGDGTPAQEVRGQAEDEGGVA